MSPADFGPSQAIDQANFVLLFSHGCHVFWRAQVRLEQLARDLDLFSGFFFSLRTTTWRATLRRAWPSCVQADELQLL